MNITNGQLAPAFTATTFKGESINLLDYKGKKVWLAFHRWASCPLCNMRIQEVQERYAEFQEQGIELIAVFQSPPENIAKYVGKGDPPFAIIADPDLVLYDMYNVRPNWMGLMYPRVIIGAIRAVLMGFFSVKIDGPLAMIPADFLVDPEGLVWRAYYGEAASDHIPYDDVFDFGKDKCLDMPDASVVV